MNQVEEESLYHSLEEEAIVDCLLVEPRTDQVSVSGVWCFDEDIHGKCIKTEDAPYKLGVPDSNLNSECVDTTKLNALDVLPHEVGVENLLAANGVSACDEYLLDIGYVDYGSNEDLHVGNCSSESRFPMFHDKGSYGIRNSLTENIRGSKCQSYFIGKTTCDLHHSYNCNCNCIFGSSSESKTVDKFGDFSKSFLYEENKEDNPSPRFAQNGMEVSTICRDVPGQDHHGGVGSVTHKRSRKPTKRYIDESSNLNLRNCKKRREASSVSKVKISKIRRPKIQNEVEAKEKLPTSEISFGKAIQVPFISQGPTECQKNNSPPTIENRVEGYSSDDDSETMTKSESGGNPRKHHRLWSVSEVKKLIDGVAHFGVGKWTHIKKLLFSTSVHRTPVDLKDKWRNLLKASRALNGTSRIEDEQKRSQPWRPLPNSILCRVRELASVYPYPREGNPKISKSKFPLARHVSSPARIKGTTNNNNNQVPVV